ncbi:MAG TPA: TetR/AcrR family transcriptional regulator [Bacteroidia bacterium]|nr:TetR/AcrR family transcriptional regulator [Bacteroidia bacterium]HNS11576.1 TetR/AcrR family transcriptional regulator [Bacteroidia bacterium]
MDVKLEGDRTTESKILDAARKIFLEKGLSGARMQDIADEACLNKALLHYYYRSKEKLFQTIFEDELLNFFNNMQEIMNSPVSLFDKIERLVAKEIDTMIACPQLPIFILAELTKDPDSCLMQMKNMEMNKLYEKFRLEVEAEIEKGAIKKVSPNHLFLNLMAMTGYPFIAKPVVKGLFNLDEIDYTTFVKQHKKEVSRHIIESLKP